MGADYKIVFIFLFISMKFIEIKSELTPPYFNLAEGRKIYSSATCGVGTDGPELYCKLVGAVGNESERLIQGQVCDFCDVTKPEKHHPPEYAIDGTENWWQSPPLSRGMKYNEVNLTIDFGQEFHVAYLFLRMGNSPRPGLWTVEKSSDYGKTWQPWQHFSDTPTDCETYFGKDSFKPITRDDDVICTTEYSKIVPLEGGEIPVMLLNNRPSANNYFNSSVLQEWTRATNVRIRLLRTKTLLGHLMSVARQDPTVTRRYFYSIKDISIGGRCVCNGHASTCHVLDELSPNRLLACQCQHNTCGIQCSDCCPGFEQKKWRQNTKAHPFKCEPCNCFGHSRSCVYSEEVDEQSLSLDIHGVFEGGGVCQNCQHNTEGINCNKCKPKFYRPHGRSWNDTNVCESCNCDFYYSTGNCAEGNGRCECRIEYQEPRCDSCSYGYFGYPKCRPCECFLNGTDGYYCEAQDGKCPCKVNFGGDYCNTCAEGYYDFPNCTECRCNAIGTISGRSCDAQTGQCPCKSNFAGKHCGQCKNGYYDYPTCVYANCDIHGTVEEICDKKSGTCLCKEGYGGYRCDQCLPGYYNYPDCVPCNCSAAGSVSTNCDTLGKCHCLSNFAGKQCTLCSAGYYKYPECLACNCNDYGSDGRTCNSEGQCKCSPNFDGALCETCKEGFYNFPACEECNCDPAGVIAKFAGCGSVPAGELCQCKDRVEGRICDVCKPLYWNLTISNSQGCQECDCFADGTVGSLDTCDSKTGQCTCKPSVGSRDCSECKDGSFDLYGQHLFGCKDCGCDKGGSVHPVCDKESGQCKCHPRIAGRDCTHPVTTHYFPTLYQFQFEYEDGYNPSGGLVRYHFDEHIFPHFSKKGYAVFSPLQNEIFNDIEIIKSSVYRMVIRYVNRNEENVVGYILITSENPNEVDQSTKVIFPPSTKPQFITVSGPAGPSPLVLDPGHYTISLKADKGSLFLDYFVLLPAAYYEATILTKQIETPCEIGSLELCRHFEYPSIHEYGPVSKALVPTDEGLLDAFEIYAETQHLAVLNEDLLPLLTPTQQKLNYNLNIARTGKYVIVIDYVSDLKFPELYTVIRVNLLDDEERDGFVTIYPCMYTTVCRQPVVDEESREKIFHLNHEKLHMVQINGDDSTRVAIKSVTAIPYEDWSLDYIKPNSVCVMKDDECVKGLFRHVPDAKRIEFELDHEHLIAHKNPPHVSDNTTKLIYLDDKNSTIRVQMKVVSAGPYNVLVKYYQPNHPKFNIIFKIETGRQTHSGKLDLPNCPSNIGCRQMIKFENNAPWIEIDDNFTITLTNDKPKGVWLDFVLLVPADQFTQELLIEEPFDQTKEFIQECGQNHFHIQLNATDFCRNTVFSLTADYNSGALPCNCDYEGSTSFECDPFGGQCQCKSNVIGRRCDACRTGFFGFPDCRPCNCPSTALCEKDTGQCICPPQVTGEKCDKCIPYTFGFDQITGCESCNCNQLGVINGNLQCDLNNGSCECYPNIVGRSCDRCINGYFQFPECRPCNCDIRGTTDDICDQEYETCFCKKHVQGRSCDHCVDGTYNLQETNPDGCTKCFCFGKTSRCESAFLRPFNVSMMGSVTVNTINLSPKDIEIHKWQDYDFTLGENETSVEIDLTVAKDNATVYFGVMEYLLDQNNHLAAYGGFLTYNIFYTTNIFGKAIIAPDIILVGKHMTIFHQSYEQPAIGHLFHGAVPMVESSFSTANGGIVTREMFMILLRDLESIYIRASYWEQSVVSKISDIYLTIADEDDEHYSLYEELAVEKCQCPPGYKGYSCEDCAPGYYRDPNGPHGGYCIPCQCNGHASTCDCDTGICNDCQHSTMGEHCEMCIEGYYGNATYGTPNDCMICACPLPIETNNFATSCDISEDGTQIHCNCRKGYTGAKCQSCAAGYYGQPEVEGEICRPCECSGNIDPTQAGSCDTITGECVMCLNNTFGRACNLCAPGFFGDAVKLKDCQSCICHETGTDFCDSFTGICQCHPNVIGAKCDRCEIDHYGFESRQGCKACDCGIASNSTQCDDHSGECRCKKGVTGRQCDRCLPGFWNYTSNGCVPCSCNTDYSRGYGCSPLTGQCECLPGVVGEKCDHCPYRWVLIPDTGCQECDVCHHALLDVTDKLRNEIDPVIIDFKTIAGGYFTSQKLNYFADLVSKLGPQIKILDPENVDLTPLKQEIESLEMDTKNHNRKFSYTDQNAKDVSLSSNKILEEVNDYVDDSQLIEVTAQNTIKEVKKLVDSFSASESSTVIENALHEAKNILESLNGYEIDHNNVKNQLENAKESKKRTEDFKYPVGIIDDSVQQLKRDLGNYSDRLESLHSRSEEVNLKVAEAMKLHHKNNESPVFSKFETLSEQHKEVKDNIKNATNLLKKTNNLIDPIYQTYKQVEDTNNNLKDKNAEVDVYLPNRDVEYEQLVDRLNASEKHRERLQKTADDLELHLLGITANSEQALKAANAYSNIVDAVKNARLAVREATYAAGNATKLSEGAEERAYQAYKNATDLLNTVKNSHAYILNELEPKLNKSSAAVQEVRDVNQQSDDVNTAINLALDSISTTDTPDDIWREAKPKAEIAIKNSKEALDIIMPMNNQLSSDLKLAKKMPKEVDITNKNIAQATAQIDRIKDHVPRIKALIDEIERKEDHLSMKESVLSDRIGKLKKQIEMARDIANNIKVGVQFYPNTTLELQPPESLPLLASHSKITTYFKTDKPNGFIMYLGNENATVGDRPAKNNDFMALEIENGYPVLTTDLGSGPRRTIVQKPVSDNQWRQAIIERADNNVKLTIREELEDGKEQSFESETVLPEEHQIFNLDENSRLFVGGYPPDFNIQEGIKYSSFEGQIEDLKIGESEVGLWNFVDGQDNSDGALARDKLINKEEPATGYRFGGSGYVVLAKTYSFLQRSSIQFKFKTSRSTKDGLLFYAEGNRNNYISIEMRNGGIFFHYRLGEHMVTMGLQTPLNDGKWHKIEAERNGRKGHLKIDDNLVYEGETPYGTEENLSISDSLFFGGYSGKINHSEITNKHFDGCIDDVFIFGNKVDLSQNKIAYGVKPGCPQKFSTVLSFAPNQIGYLRRPNLNVDKHLQINFKFRTRQELGVLLYITNYDQSSTIGITIEQGLLVLRSLKNPLYTSKRYDDGEWHIVNAAHDQNKIWMVVDDVDRYEQPSSLIPLIISHGDVYFGGLPKHFTTARDALGTSAYFTGCISDVTLNSQVVNFANATDMQSARLDNCEKELFDYDAANVKIYYPTDEHVPLPYDEEGMIHKEHDEDVNRFPNRFEPEEVTEYPFEPLTHKPIHPIHHGPTTKQNATTSTTTTTTTTTTKMPITTSTTPKAPIAERLPLPPPPHQPVAAKPTTTKRPRDKNQICELPLEPDIDVDFDAGYRFGTTVFGRIELQKVPAKMRRTYDMSFQFKTTGESGLILYASDRANDYVAVFLENGKVVHLFNASSGLVRTESSLQYNDGEWHTVQFGRTKNRASITVDDDDINLSSDDDHSEGVHMNNIASPIFIGGVNKTISNEVRSRNLIDEEAQFTGCIKNLHMFGKPTVEPGSIHGVLPCSEQIENGVFFGKSGGYVKLREKFKVGLEMTISLDIKPRTLTGFLLSVHGRKAFLILEMINGTIYFTVDNGDGPIEAKFLPENGENYCDGEWRTVQIIKSKYVISIQVNAINSDPAIGNALNPSTDTTRPLFLGGHPHLGTVRGLKTRQPYAGCIRNLKILDVIEPIVPSMAVGHVHTGVCSLN